MADSVAGGSPVSSVLTRRIAAHAGARHGGHWRCQAAALLHTIRGEQPACDLKLPQHFAGPFFLPKSFRLDHPSPHPTPQVAQHNTPHDCWVTFRGAVYDLTALVAENPGPLCMPIVTAAGQDITHWFDAEGEPRTHVDPTNNLPSPYCPQVCGHAGGGGGRACGCGQVTGGGVLGLMQHSAMALDQQRGGRPAQRTAPVPGALNAPPSPAHRIPCPGPLRARARHAARQQQCPRRAAMVEGRTIPGEGPHQSHSNERASQQGGHPMTPPFLPAHPPPKQTHAR